MTTRTHSPSPLLRSTLATFVGALICPAAHARPHVEVKATTAPDPLAIRPANQDRTWNAAQQRRALGTMRREIRSIWSGQTLRRGTTAVYIREARSGKLLYSVHPKAPLNPASNVKLISTATALNILGPQWQYETKLYGPTPENGIANGDVFLRGSWDPTLGSRALATLARRVRSNGITTITGDVVLGLDPRRDAIGLPIVRLRVTGANKVGQPPTIVVDPPSDFVRVQVDATSAWVRRSRIKASSRLITEGTASHVLVTVTGTMRIRSKKTIRRWISQRAPLSAHLLRRALQNAGVTVAGTTRRQTFDDYVSSSIQRNYLPIPLASRKSRPVRELVRTINKRSLNFLSDRLVMTAGAHAYGGPPTMPKAILAMKQWLRKFAGISPKSITLDTGSGLSYKTQLSAKDIVRVLRVGAGYANPGKTDAALPDAFHSTFAESLAVAGTDGTLRRRFAGSDVKGKLFGKTGTLTGIVALSGILKGTRDRALAFSIVSNGTLRKHRRNIRLEHEAIVEAMHRYLHADAR